MKIPLDFDANSDHVTSELRLRLPRCILRMGGYALPGYCLTVMILWR